MVKKGDTYGATAFVALTTPSVARVSIGFDVAYYAEVDFAPGPNGGIFVERDVTSPSGSGPLWVMGEGDTAQYPGHFGGAIVDLGPIPTNVPPALGPGGHVGQLVPLTGPGVDTTAILLKAPGPIGQSTLICYEGQQVADAGPTHFLGELAVPFGVTASGEVGFRSEITGGTALLLADTSQALGVAAMTGHWAFGSPTELLDVVAAPTGGEHLARFNSAGHSAFRATTNGPSLEGVWFDMGPSQGFVSVAHGNMIADGYGTLTFRTFKSPSSTPSGDVVFRACVDLGCTRDGIWRWTAGWTPILIAKDDGEAPDGSGSTSGGEVFDFFSDPTVGLSGRFAFRAVLKQAGSPEGIWRWSPPFDLRRIVRTGDTLRGTNLTFSTFEETLAVADSGEIAFLATMSDGQQGLFVTSEVGTIVKVAKVGEAFTIDGANKVISGISFAPGSSAQGNGGFVQALGAAPNIAAVAYKLTFTDLQEAILLTTLE